MLQRRSKHGWNEFSVENTEPIWKKYLDQVRILCTDPRFLAKNKSWLVLSGVCIEIFRISTRRDWALEQAQELLLVLGKPLWDPVQITSSNRNEHFYLHTAHKSNALQQGPDCWSVFIPFKASDKIVKGCRRGSGGWKMLCFWPSLQKRRSSGHFQGSVSVHQWQVHSEMVPCAPDIHNFTPTAPKSQAESDIFYLLFPHLSHPQILFLLTISHQYLICLSPPFESF